MPNERKTENLVRNMLRNKGFYDNQNIIIEEQKSDSPTVNKLLKSASEQGDASAQHNLGNMYRAGVKVSLKMINKPYAGTPKQQSKVLQLHNSTWG